jgi:hypothetical protein
MGPPRELPLFTELPTVRAFSDTADDEDNNYSVFLGRYPSCLSFTYSSAACFSSSLLRPTW